MTRVSTRAGLDGLLARGAGGSFVMRVIRSPSRLLGTLTFWAIFLGALSIAVDVLGIAALEDLVHAVWAYIPNILAAILIFVVAGLIATAIVELVDRTMGDTPTGGIVKAVAPVLVMAIAVFMILDQLEIAPTIVTITYAALVGAVALGMALAFGLGGRDVAGRAQARSTPPCRRRRSAALACATFRARAAGPAATCTATPSAPCSGYRVAACSCSSAKANSPLSSCSRPVRERSTSGPGATAHNRRPRHATRVTGVPATRCAARPPLHF